MKSLKKVLKVALLILSGVFLLTAALAAFTQTQFFRDRLRSAALTSLDSLLDAEVRLGNLTGNLLTGFSLDHISIKVASGFLLSSEQVDVRYDLFQIPGKVVSVDAVTIVRPEITLVRAMDGRWNFERMIRPTAPDTGTHRPLDWVIRIRRLEIQEGTFSLVDSVSLTRDDHPAWDPATVEYHHFVLQQLNLVTSALINPEEQRATISNLSFVCAEPFMRLHEFTGEFLLTPSQASVRSLHIRTDSSDIELSGSVHQLDVLGGPDVQRLQHAPVRASLHMHRLDFAELKRFIPQIAFLHGSVAGAIEAEGPFGALNVGLLSLRVGGSSISLQGSVLNLNDPSNLTLKISSSNSRISSLDVQALLPTFHLPDYRELGTTTLNLDFEGKPWDFKTAFVWKTDAGTVQGDVALSIGGSDKLRYRGKATVQDLNLVPITGVQRLAGQLNGAVMIEGRGVSLDRLDALCTAHVDSSQFMHRSFSSSDFTVEAKGRILSATVNGTLGSMQTALRAGLDIRDRSRPSFSIDGTVLGVNLQDFLHDPGYDSDLSMGIHVRGTGLSWKTFNGEFLADISPSRFREYAISRDSVHLSLDQRDSLQKKLTLESTVADFSLEGAFDLDYLVRLLAFEVANISDAIAQKVEQIDTTLVRLEHAEMTSELRRGLSSPAAVLNTRYRLELKNLEPVSILAGERTFNGSGTLAGTILGDYDRLRLRGDLLLDDFFYGTAESGLLIQKGRATLDIDNLLPKEPLKDMAVELTLSSGEMHINRTAFDSVQLSLAYQGGHALYAGRMTMNQTLHLDVRGTSDVGTREVTFRPQRMNLAYRDYIWRADSGLSVIVAGQGVRVRDLTLRHDSQSVAASWFIGSDGKLEASIAGDRLDLTALKYFLSQEEIRPTEDLFTGALNFTATATGTTREPRCEVQLRTGTVSFRGVPLGTVRGSASYGDLVLKARAEVDSRSDISQGRADMTVAGELPVDLALAAVEQRFPEAPMDFSVRSDGIQIGILDPLVPTFNQLSGILRCDLKVVGSPRKPTYEGSIRIDSCSFLFVPNNIMYTLEGSFQPQGDRIKVLDAVIRNIREDEQFGRKGLARVTGDFALLEFRPTDFNLFTRGQLLVVKEATLTSDLSVYGNLFVDFGESGLHFTGTIENSLLRGRLSVRNSSLVFPPTQTAAARQYATSVPLFLVNDTLKIEETEDRSSVRRYFGGASDSTFRPTEISPHAVTTRSFTDGLQYNLDITTEGGNTELRMVFYNAPPEELVATINGKFSITEDGRKWYGDLRVDKAYYLFYNKRFNAEGSLRYTGDFLNPELDIAATYQGTRVREDTTSANRSPERIVVTVKIAGRRLEPKIEMSMTIDGEDYASYTKGPKSGDVQTDAIAFIISGTFPLTRPERNDLAANLGRTVGASLVTGATSLLSGTLSDFLRRETGFITSLELGYGNQGGLSETPDIRLSGVAAGGLWRYGGKINDPLSNINVSILYSLGDVFDAPRLRNFMIELEQKVETATGAQNREQAIRSARLFYRISF